MHIDDDHPLHPLRQGKPLRLDQAPTDPRFWAFLPGLANSKSAASRRRRTQVQSAIIAPMIMEGEVFGALSLTANRPAAFSDADLHLLASFAVTASAAIQNAILHAELQNLATTDPLTGLLNRRAILELGQREVDRYHRLGRPLAVLLFDIDHFKAINDTYGHAIGDQVLGGVVERCFANIRHVDILGRYGGDEFIILLTEADADLARSIAERVRRSIQDKPIQTEAGPVRVSLSMGLTGPTPEIHDLSDFVKAADQALYRAKQSGRNRVEVTAQTIEP
jgi:diguanylate cyclase (GGDEF)-like protein